LFIITVRVTIPRTLTISWCELHSSPEPLDGGDVLWVYPCTARSCRVTPQPFVHSRWLRVHSESIVGFAIFFEFNRVTHMVVMTRQATRGFALHEFSFSPRPSGRSLAVPWLHRGARMLGNALSYAPINVACAWSVSYRCSSSLWRRFFP